MTSWIRTVSFRQSSFWLSFYLGLFNDFFVFQNQDNLPILYKDLIPSWMNALVQRRIYTSCHERALTFYPQCQRLFRDPSFKCQRCTPPCWLISATSQLTAPSGRTGCCRCATSPFAKRLGDPSGLSTSPYRQDTDQFSAAGQTMSARAMSQRRYVSMMRLLMLVFHGVVLKYFILIIFQVLLTCL